MSGQDIPPPYLDYLGLLSRLCFKNLSLSLKRKSEAQGATEHCQSTAYTLFQQEKKFTI